MDPQYFEAGDTILQSGTVLPGVRLAYAVHGTLNTARDNGIVYPSHYAGTHDDTAWNIGSGRALDPGKYCIIVTNLLGNGVSTSPSCPPPGMASADFPAVTMLDNIRLQHRLVTEVFGISRLALVTGHSMGAQQAFHWGALYPQMVERIAPFCGSARTSRHNFLFLEGIKSALTADAAWDNGHYAAQPVTGLRAFARVYAGWAWSQAWFREQLDMQVLGLPTLEAFLAHAWEPHFLSKDANDLLAMLSTWQCADISANPLYEGNYLRALAAIRAKAIVMPCQTDLYFPPQDSEIEVAQMPNAELRIIPSIWGHMAGGGLNPVDAAFIDAALTDLLAR
jgi:homoserine O-acetyltransferase